jgi:hypothetical protein
MAKQRFAITLEAFKTGFVDKAVILEISAAKRRSYLQAGGELVRRLTKRTLKSAKSSAVSVAFAKKTGWPIGKDGKPRRRYASNPAPRFPLIRVKKDGDLKNISNVLFRIDNLKRPTQVEIGPPKLKPKPVPRTLESGGIVQTKTRRRIRKIGDGGEIRVDKGRVTKSGKLRFRKRSKTAVKTNTDHGVAVVVYAKLRTANQVRRANEINQSLYKPSRTISVPGRRYMRQILRMATTLPKNVAEWERKTRALFNGYLKTIRPQARVRRYRA